jgi:hypothetical protein
VPTPGITGDGDDRSRPGGPVKVGLDGGYVHARDGTNRKAGWFEMIVGVSTPSDRATKRFGFVSGYDTHAKRRLCRVLNAQGMEPNQALTFLSDGGDTVRDVPLALSPVAEHVVDWFHIAMRLTVLRQQLKRYFAGVPALDVGKLDKRVEGINWSLWHGNVYRARTALVDWEDALGVYQDDAPDSRKLIKGVRDVRRYVRANEAFIPNYGERYRSGEPISTTFVESGINQVISKRFVKKQQMRWTKRGAHRLLQVRTQQLNGDLHATFCRWYPHMSQSPKAAAPFRAQAA